jgi:hypothetical protein
MLTGKTFFHLSKKITATGVPFCSGWVEKIMQPGFPKKEKRANLYAKSQVLHKHPLDIAYFYCYDIFIQNHVDGRFIRRSFL